ncbi:cadherin-related family member 2 [Malaclemys terrapin pileata]|uniref:cadherin-related family member 2 n=1 Tax=Malaclemys terrapin pileata TaxID=2991368 RepID=UPI0023A8771B|nr:cadherin-related family member 2 [Malaclemys terrapin pileata]
MAWCPLLLLPVLLVAVSGNTAPRFNITIAYVPEDLAVGAWAFQLTALDADGDPLFYGMNGQDAYYFSVNAMTGDVLLAASLDRETKEKLSVTITVTDKINTEVSRKLPIIVQDRNDNPPIFQNQPYIIDLPETWPIGSAIYRVLATDADSGNDGRVRYEIVSVTPDAAKNHQLFYILQNGTVGLNGSLSYNNQSTYYQLQLKATDGVGCQENCTYLSSVAYLSVNVVDKPDLAPQFLNEPYVGSVPENCPLGTPVLTVWAIDRDKGVNYALNYSLLNASVPFAIDLATGTITVRSALDREQLSSEEVLLEVLAQEENLDIYGQVAQASTTVTVQVTDVNDNTPQFYDCELPACDFAATPQSRFGGSLEEHSSAGVPVRDLHIVAHDPDKGSNGAFELQLQGPDAASFSVSPTRITGTGAVQVLVKHSSTVDYERVPVMTVEIVANDTRNPGNCCSIATVTIQLLDINDHSPEFKQSTYWLQVPENSPAGTVISTITATDPDSGGFGRITYRLLPESMLHIFAVNASSGEVLVRNGSFLDRETRTPYYVTLQAVDGGNMTGSTFLEITLQDANDNAPVISGSYNIFINEEQENISVQIQAFDSDEPGTNNSRLRFQLEPGAFSANFTIDPTTGVLRSVGALDREALEPALKGKVVVTVRVHDLGVPQLSSLVNVTITVEDVNDNAPVFLNEPYAFSVREGLAGAFVGSVEAEDADQTEVHHRISFQLVSSSGSSNFLLRSIRLGPGHYQGNLSLDPDVALDYDRLSPARFTLTVQAENTGTGDALNAVPCTVQVQVLDVNDEPPTLVPASPQDVSVAEDAKPGLLTTLQASDLDTNHSLHFQELGLACYKGAGTAGHVCQDWFYLEPNGSVFLNSSQLDYEACDRVTIALRVEDTHTEEGNPYSNNATLRVLISDVNDNSPEFLRINDTFVVVPEVSPVDLPVAVVKARDADSRPHGAITFSISKVLFLQDNGPSHTLTSVFKVATAAEGDLYVGSIQVASNLDGSVKGRYQVTVEAKDSGTPSLNSSAVLDIFTVDQSYRVRLVFSTSVNEVQENSDRIKAALTVATRTTVYVAVIQSAADAQSRLSRAQEKSVMEAYFVYSNGTALGVNELSILVQSNSQALSELIQLGLTIIGPGTVVEPNKENELVGIIAGLAGGLVLLLLVMTLALLATSRSYRRKLKAMKALKVASTLTANVAQQGPTIPGTNKYNAEGANPVLNLMLDAPADLGFDEDSNSDAASLNSLDENIVENLAEGSPGAPELQLGWAGGPAQLGGCEEPLTAALQGHRTTPASEPARRPGDPNKATFTFSNPCLDTTDL